MKNKFGCSVTGAILLVIGLVVIVNFVGLPISTGNGNQVGYISAIEKTGTIWKTGRVYVKPTLESTQEDIYCVIDESVFSELEKASVNKSRVKVNHYSVISSGISKCEDEDAIIKSVEVLN